MTPLRVAAALAALVTAVLLQATVVGPAAGLVPVSLPAVLVAVIALCEGPATGICLGFTAGLLADLGSSHPAGVLALAWLAVGTVCGLSRDGRRRLPAQAAVAGTVCALATVAAILLERLLSVGTAPLWTCLPALVADAVLALAVMPIAAAFLRSHALQPVTGG